LAVLAALGCLNALASEHVDPRTGVVIRCEVDDSMFPASWKSSEIGATATPLRKDEVARATRIATAAISLYPTGLLRKNLKAVYFADEITFFGLGYGGTNSRDTVYIADRGAENGFSDAFLARTFHHEFSSILLRNYTSRFDADEWVAANGSAVRYGEGGIAALRNGSTDTNYNEKYHVDGFLNQYATSSIEEDFNTFAEGVFSGDRAFWTLVDRFPKVARKTGLIVDFYRSLDPGLDEAFFRSLAKK
jgi:hypothetical protein